MKKSKQIIWGSALIILGIIFVLKIFNVISFEIFFDGWWTLFIIVPCAIALFTEKEKIGNLIGVLIGVGLLLASRDVLDFELVMKLFIPIIMILIGIRIIFGSIFKTSFRKNKKRFTSDVGASKNYVAVFSGIDADFSGKEFDGTEAIAIFGGVDIRLQSAIIDHDVYINATAIFGGVEIRLPQNVNVEVSPVSLFGGVDNKKHQNSPENTVTVHIDAYAIFGGVDIK